ncbi:MAG: SDR family NAD(P)-dependent oxidoreductase [Beijerinckiaceae bacterium]
MAYSFKDKTVLVTGAAGIFGREFCRAFAEAGAALAVTDVAGATIDDHPGAARIERFTCDLTDAAAIEGLARDVVDRIGVPDVVVANAGVYPFGGLFDTDVATFDKVFDINLRANFLLAKHFGKAMIDAGRQGSFIFVGSAAAHVLRTNGLAYCASKRALHWLMQGVALELGPHGIRANMIEPGLATGGSGGPMPPGYAEAIVAQVPLGRLVKEGEVGRAALFLASDDAAFTTGMSFSVDGGGAIPRRLKLS